MPQPLELMKPFLLSRRWGGGWELAVMYPIVAEMLEGVVGQWLLLGAGCVP